MVSSNLFCGKLCVGVCFFLHMCICRNLLRDLYWLGWWLCTQEQSLIVPLSMIHKQKQIPQIPPIHIDPQLHRYWRFCDFQVKKHLLCRVVNRCFKSMHQPFQPWMKEILTGWSSTIACNCWEKPLMSNSVHGCRIMSYHLTFPSLLPLATSRCHFHPVHSWRRAWSF